MLIKVTQCRKPARGLPQQWQAPAEPRGWQKSHAQRAPGRQPHADQAPRLWKGLREATPAEARAPRAVGAASWGWPRTAWFLGAAQPSEPGGPLWLAVEVAARCSRNAPRSAECPQHSLFSLNTGLAVRPLHTHTHPPKGTRHNQDPLLCGGQDKPRGVRAGPLLQEDGDTPRRRPSAQLTSSRETYWQTRPGEKRPRTRWQETRLLREQDARPGGREGRASTLLQRPGPALDMTRPRPGQNPK